MLANYRLNLELPPFVIGGVDIALMRRWRQFWHGLAPHHFTNAAGDGVNALIAPFLLWRLGQGWRVPISAFLLSQFQLLPCGGPS